MRILWKASSKQKQINRRLRKHRHCWLVKFILDRRHLFACQIQYRWLSRLDISDASGSIKKPIKSLAERRMIKRNPRHCWLERLSYNSVVRFSSVIDRMINFRTKRSALILNLDRKLMKVSKHYILIAVIASTSLALTWFSDNLRVPPVSVAFTELTFSGTFSVKRKYPFWKNLKISLNADFLKKKFSLSEDSKVIRL